jgi:hypothetical protein
VSTADDGAELTPTPGAAEPGAEPGTVDVGSPRRWLPLAIAVVVALVGVIAMVKDDGSDAEDPPAPSVAPTTSSTEPVPLVQARVLDGTTARMLLVDRPASGTPILLELASGRPLAIPFPVTDEIQLRSVGDTVVAVDPDNGDLVSALDGMVLAPSEGRPLRLLRDDSCECALVERDESGLLFASSLRRFDLTGTELGDPVTIPNGTRPVAGYRDGSIVVDDRGYAWSVGAGRRDQRLAEGTPVAVVGEHVVVVTCTALGQCGLAVVGPDSGRRAVGGPVGVQFLRSEVGYPSSPDGTQVLLPAASNQGRPLLILLDVVARHARVLPWSGPTVLGPEAIAWTPDGNWVLFAGQRSLQAIDLRRSNLVDLGIATDEHTRLLVLPEALGG